MPLNLFPVNLEKKNVMGKEELNWSSQIGSNIVCLPSCVLWVSEVTIEYAIASSWEVYDAAAAAAAAEVASQLTETRFCPGDVGPK